MTSSTGHILSGAASSSSSVTTQKLKSTRLPADEMAGKYKAFPELIVDGESFIKAMICRAWDVKNPFGKYIGTEYILSDEQGHAMHCVARSSISHCVVQKLKAGLIYSIGRFTLVPNKPTYRVRRDDPYLIQLEGNTIIQELQCSTDGFVRHPFHMKPIEEISPNGSKYLIDVIGRIINVGATKPTRNGSQYLDFTIINERGRAIKATVWGSLCEDIKTHASPTDGMHIFILPAMNAKEYRGELQLTSTSGTILFYGNEIPEISTLRKIMSEKDLPPLEIDGSLLQLLKLGREQKGLNLPQSETFKCKVQIKGVRPRNSWNYYSCGQGGCQKGVKPIDNYFWCEACEKRCDFPIIRYRLQLDVADDTTSLVVTVFDEQAEALLQKKAAAVMEGLRDNGMEIEIPGDILRLVGTTQVFELKTHTYYNHGQYESFTASAVHPCMAHDKADVEIKQDQPPYASDNATSKLNGGSQDTTNSTKTPTDKALVVAATEPDKQNEEPGIDTPAAQDHTQDKTEEAYEATRKRKLREAAILQMNIYL